MILKDVKGYHENSFISTFFSFSTIYLIIFRFTETGEIVPHSVLGPVRDFLDEAIKRNEIRVSKNQSFVFEKV